MISVICASVLAVALGMDYGKRPEFSANPVELGRGVDGELRYAVQLPPNDFPCFARMSPSVDCRLRATIVGSDETLVIGESFVVRADTNSPRQSVRVPFNNILRRYPGLRKWSNKDISNDLVLFITARPLEGNSLAIDDFRFFGLKPRKAPPFTPERTFPVRAMVGSLVFTHVADKPTANTTLAEYRIRYVDGEEESVWVSDTWNCGRRDQKGAGDRANALTWWGPTGFAKAEVIRQPVPGSQLEWTGVYRTRYLVQHPEKEIAAVDLRSDPDAGFVNLGFEIVSPGKTELGVVEASDGATFLPGSVQLLDVMEYSAVPQADGAELDVFLEKKGGRRMRLGVVKMTRSGRLGWGSVKVTLPTDRAWIGPVRFKAGVSESSWLGLLPPSELGAAECHYSMITSGQLSDDQYVWIRRLGYDMVKTHTIGWGFDPVKWKRNLEQIHAAGLLPALRPSMAARFDVAMVRQPVQAYHPVKGEWTWDHDFAWDLGDENSREHVREYYRRVTSILKNCPPLSSIEPCYGVTRGVGCPGNGIAPGSALWKIFLQRIEGKFPGVDPSALTLRAVWDDDRLLGELIQTGLESNRALQDEVSAIVKEALPNLRQVFHAGWRDSEHVVDARDFVGYLRLCEGLRKGSLCNAAAERYSLSFEQWLAGRTFGLRHCDEGCQNPPTYEHLRRAYMWMAVFQTLEGNYCRFSVGRPCAHDVAELKPFACLLADAEYLPDPIGFSRSFETGLSEAPRMTKNPRHSQTMAHHGLINLCRACDLNPDRFIFDAFPEKDEAFKGRVILDDLNGPLAPKFAERIESLKQKGVKYLTFKPKEVQFGWNVTDVPKATRNTFLRRVETMGGFRRKAFADADGVSAIPFRGRNGRILLCLVNENPVSVATDAGIRADLADGKRPILDFSTGSDVCAELRDGYLTVHVRVDALGATVLEF